MGRQAKGVRLVRLDEGQSLAAMIAFPGGNDEEQETPELVQAQSPSLESDINQSELPPADEENSDQDE